MSSSEQPRRVLAGANACLEEAEKTVDAEAIADEQEAELDSLHSAFEISHLQGLGQVQLELPKATAAHVGLFGESERAALRKWRASVDASSCNPVLYLA